jgi:hypothetical protein
MKVACALAYRLKRQPSAIPILEEFDLKNAKELPSACSHYMGR